MFVEQLLAKPVGLIKSAFKKFLNFSVSGPTCWPAGPRVDFTLLGPRFRYSAVLYYTLDGLDCVFGFTLDILFGTLLYPNLTGLCFAISYISKTMLFIP